MAIRTGREGQQQPPTPGPAPPPWWRLTGPVDDGGWAGHVVPGLGEYGVDWTMTMGPYGDTIIAPIDPDTGLPDILQAYINNFGYEEGTSLFYKMHPDQAPPDFEAGLGEGEFVGEFDIRPPQGMTDEYFNWEYYQYDFNNDGIIDTLDWTLAQDAGYSQDFLNAMEGVITSEDEHTFEGDVWTEDYEQEISEGELIPPFEGGKRKYGELGQPGEGLISDIIGGEQIGGFWQDPEEGPRPIRPPAEDFDYIEPGQYKPYDISDFYTKDIYTPPEPPSMGISEGEEIPPLPDISAQSEEFFSWLQDNGLIDPNIDYGGWIAGSTGGPDGQGLFPDPGGYPWEVGAPDIWLGSEIDYDALEEMGVGVDSWIEYLQGILPYGGTQYANLEELAQYLSDMYGNVPIQFLQDAGYLQDIQGWISDEHQFGYWGEDFEAPEHGPITHPEGPDYPPGYLEGRPELPHGFDLSYLDWEGAPFDLNGDGIVDVMDWNEAQAAGYAEDYLNDMSGFITGGIGLEFDAGVIEADPTEVGIGEGQPQMPEAVPGFMWEWDDYQNMWDLVEDPNWVERIPPSMGISEGEEIDPGWTGPIEIDPDWAGPIVEPEIPWWQEAGFDAPPPTEFKGWVQPPPGMEDDFSETADVVDPSVPIAYPDDPGLQWEYNLETGEWDLAEVGGTEDPADVEDTFAGYSEETWNASPWFEIGYSWDAWNELPYYMQEAITNMFFNLSIEELGETFTWQSASDEWNVWQTGAYNAYMNWVNDQMLLGHSQETIMEESPFDWWLAQNQLGQNWSSYEPEQYVESPGFDPYTSRGVSDAIALQLGWNPDSEYDGESFDEGAQWLSWKYGEDWDPAMVGVWTPDMIDKTQYGYYDPMMEASRGQALEGAMTNYWPGYGSVLNTGAYEDMIQNQISSDLLGGYETVAGMQGAAEGQLTGIMDEWAELMSMLQASED